jgi:hypothetical protein
MVRISKDILYKEQQNDILLKILTLIGITKTNTMIERENIEREDNLKKINEMKEDINKYFTIKNKNSVKTGVHIEINIVRNICKQLGINILSIDKKRRDENNLYKSYRIYKFEIPENILDKLY